MGSQRVRHDLATEQQKERTPALRSLQQTAILFQYKISLNSNSGKWFFDTLIHHLLSVIAFQIKLLFLVLTTRLLTNSPSSSISLDWVTDRTLDSKESPGSWPPTTNAGHFQDVCDDNTLEVLTKEASHWGQCWAVNAACMRNIRVVPPVNLEMFLALWNRLDSTGDGHQVCEGALGEDILPGYHSV